MQSLEAAPAVSVRAEPVRSGVSGGHLRRGGALFAGSQFLGFTAEQLKKPGATLEPADIDLGTIRAFVTELHRQHQTRSSVARKLSALRSFGRFLRREAWTDGSLQGEDAEQTWIMHEGPVALGD